MRKKTDIRDFISEIQCSIYWDDIEKNYESDFRGWSCGFFRNMFIMAPPIDELQTEQFMEYLAESAVMNAGLKRTVDQSTICSIFEHTADERRRKEFFAEPIKKAHYYNEFKGIHVIDLSEWVDGDDLDYSRDFESLKIYLAKEQKNVRFLIWAKADGDGERLSKSLPGISFKKLQLPSPNMEQIKAYARINMKINNLYPAENVISAILKGCQEMYCKPDQFKTIDAAVAFLSEQISDKQSRELSNADIEMLQSVMAASYAAEAKPAKRIGF